MQRFFLLLLIIISFSGPIHADENLTIRRLVIFGDSLSDQGKLHRKSHGAVPVSPPYWNGRFSNGPIWADILAEKYLVINEAEGGASAVDYRHLSNSFKYKIINTLEYEIDQFLDKSSFQSDDLVIVWIGGNDYITYHWIRPKDVERVILELVIQIRRLERLGVKHVLVINLPDMGRSPVANQTDRARVMTDVTEYHNLRMKAIFERAFDPSVVKIFDAASIFGDFLRSPQSYGFLNTTGACYTGDYFGIPWSQSTESSVQYSDPDRWTGFQRLDVVPGLDSTMYRTRLWTPTPKCDGYVYMDAIHPSRNAHKLTARELDQFIQLHYTK